MMTVKITIFLILSLGLLVACRSDETPASIPIATTTQSPTQSPPTHTPAATATTTPSPMDKAQAYFLEGVTLQEEGQLELAMEAYSNAINIDPDYAEAYIHRGLCLYSEYNLEAAIVDFKTAQGLDYEPQTPQMYVNRGRAYSILEDFEAAIQDFTTALELDAGFVEAYVRRGNVYAWDMQNFDPAFSDFESAIALDPNYALIYQKRGNAYILLESYEAAIEDLNLAIDLDSQDSFNFSSRGYANFLLGESAQAISDFNQAIALEQHNTIAYYYRGLSYGSQEDFEPAIDDLRAFLEFFPEDPYAHYYLGLMHYAVVDPENAIYHFEKAIGIGLDPEVEKLAEDHIREMQVDYMARNPVTLMGIPEGLFNPQKGDEDFFQPGIASQGDWILYASEVGSILPVPSGWYINETGDQTHILFFQKGDHDEPTIFIRLATISESDGGSDPSTLRIPKIAGNLDALKVHQTLAVATIGEDKGYILVHLNQGTDASEMMLMFTSRCLDNPGGAVTHVFSAYASPQNWDAYYPILREILIHWMASDFTLLGSTLPESLMD